jgi:hypothetical protein
MKSILKTGLLAIASSALLLSPSALAQQGGPGGPGGQGGRGNRNFDPAQFQQRMMEGMRERLGVTDDAEWKVISERITKVMDVRRETGFGGGGRMGGMGMMRPPGGQDAGGRRGGFGGTQSPEAEALAKAIDSKAGKDELKAAMAKYREARKASQAKLEAAQDELKQVITVPQEAVLLQMGMIN